MSITKTKAIVISSKDFEYGEEKVKREYCNLILRGYDRWDDTQWSRSDEYQAIVLDPGFFVRLARRFLL